MRLVCVTSCFACVMSVGICSLVLCFLYYIYYYFFFFVLVVKIVSSICVYSCSCYFSVEIPVVIRVHFCD